jgi:hypothetical protein
MDKFSLKWLKNLKVKEISRRFADFKKSLKKSANLG